MEVLPDRTNGLFGLIEFHIYNYGIELCKDLTPISKLKHLLEGESQEMGLSRTKQPRNEPIPTSRTQRNGTEEECLRQKSAQWL